MAVDYDLVVVGSSWAGIYAAQKAALLQARVALVTQADELFLRSELPFICGISEAGQLNHRTLANNSGTIASEIKLPQISLAQAADRAKGIDFVMEINDSLSSLAALGVDVIVNQGEFCRLPKLAFQVAQRKLRSRYFLLATGTSFQTRFQDDEGVDGYLSWREFYHQDLTEVGQNLTVVGSDPAALELAQALVRFDKQVTLVVEKPRILAPEDPDIAMLIQARLEAEGIKIYSNSPISQIKTIGQQKWLQAGDRALMADEIIITDSRQPNIAKLNLAGVDVKYNQTRVYVNQKLQTTNPQIFACGDLIGGYSLPSITRYEVELILKNTLFFPWYKTNYHSVPWAILTQPNLARVGLNESQATQHYGDEIYVVREYFDNVLQAQVSGQTTGICKLIVRENGEILGCSLICDRAAELISTIALMIKHHLRLDRNPMRGIISSLIPTVYPSMAEILTRSSENFYRQKLQRNPKLLNRLRSWFSLRQQWH